MISRSERIYEAGQGAIRRMAKDHPGLIKLSLTDYDLQAIAAMINAALPEKKAAQPRSSKPFMAGQEAHRYLSANVPSVAWTPVSNAVLQQLGKCVTEAPHLDPLITWINGGGLSWMKEPPTTQYIARNYHDLMARALAARPKKEASQKSELDRLRDQGDL